MYYIKWRPSVLFVIGLLLSIALKAQSGRPNIILIIGDDISRDDIGAYGKNPFVKTPNVNRLAAKGWLFDNFFVTSSSCSPSRASIITGRYPHNTGAPELHQPIPASQIYFPELLKHSGYYTALLGKWHEGENTKRAYDTLITGVPLNGEGGEAQWLPVLQQRPKNKPFFLWLASFDAHRSWDREPAFRHSPDSVLVPPTLQDKPATRADLADYYAEIERLDHHIGLLLQELERERILNNTIICFVGDNGRPFPADKTRLLDRGTNTPLIIYKPGSEKNGHRRRVHALVSGIDIAPTLLDFAKIPIHPMIQGKSLLPVLSGNKDAFRKYLFTEHNWHDYKAYERAVRTGHFLYIKNFLPDLPNQGPLDAVNSPSFQDLQQALDNGSITLLQKDIFICPRPPEELYDIKSDSLQQFNLANKTNYKNILLALRGVLQQWQKETKDDFPANLTPDWYGRKKGETLPDKNKRGIPPGQHSRAERTLKKGTF